MQLLSELFIYVAFPNSAKFFGELKINYGPGQLEESRATVPLQVHHQLEGNISLDFVLWQNQDRWRDLWDYIAGNEHKQVLPGP